MGEIFSAGGGAVIFGGGGGPDSFLIVTTRSKNVQRGKCQSGSPHTFQKDGLLTPWVAWRIHHPEVEWQDLLWWVITRPSEMNLTGFGPP